MLQFLVIRESQIHALKLSQGKALVDKLAEYIRHNYPDRVVALNDPALRTHVEAAVDAGIAHGFKLECSFLAYALLSVALGSRFHEYPSVHRILHDPGTPPDLRIGRLADEITAAEWESAAMLTATPLPLHKGAAHG